MERTQADLRTQQPDHRQHVDHRRSDMQREQSLDLRDRRCRFSVFLELLGVDMRQREMSGSRLQRPQQRQITV